MIEDCWGTTIISCSRITVNLKIWLIGDCWAITMICILQQEEILSCQRYCTYCKNPIEVLVRPFSILWIFILNIFLWSNIIMRIRSKYNIWVSKHTCMEYIFKHWMKCWFSLGPLTFYCEIFLVNSHIKRMRYQQFLRRMNLVNTKCISQFCKMTRKTLCSRK